MEDPGGLPVGDTAFVDPAGLVYIQDAGPRGAGGAAGAIYQFLGIRADASFPEPVRAEVTEEGRAKLHSYSLPGGDTAHCIHVVGPDLRFQPDGIESPPALYEHAVTCLAAAYSSVLREFAAASSLGALRLLPVSGGIFAGPFQPVIAKLTFDAISAALEKLPQPTAQALASRRLGLCIFLESEYQAFRDAGFQE